MTGLDVRPAFEGRDGVRFVCGDIRDPAVVASAAEGAATVFHTAAILKFYGICTPARYNQIRNASIMAFGMVSQYLSQRGMILVDTKTEHGINAEGRVVVADEVYTMDSSRFWRQDDNGRPVTRDGKPVSFSKEFARGMVTEKNQQFSVEQANEIAVRYIQGLQHLTGTAFEADLRERDERLIESTNLILDTLL